MTNEELDEEVQGYFRIKKEGKPCEIAEAYEWYKDVFVIFQGNVLDTIKEGLHKCFQNISIDLIKKKDLENILEECDFMSGQYNAYKQTLELLYNMKNNPQDCMAWKGDIGGEVAYYAELKKKDGKLEYYT